MIRVESNGPKARFTTRMKNPRPGPGRGLKDFQLPIGNWLPIVLVNTSSHNVSAELACPFPRELEPECRTALKTVGLHLAYLCAKPTDKSAQSTEMLNRHFESTTLNRGLVRHGQQKGIKLALSNEH